MSNSSEFLGNFDSGGRFREGDGSVQVVFLTNHGAKIPGHLVFKSGFCVSAEMVGTTSWSYPDGSPLNGVRLLLHFAGEDPLVIFIHRGRILTHDLLERETPELTIPESAGRRKIIANQRALTAFDSLSDKDRKAVIDSVSDLADQDPSQWPNDRVSKVGKDKPVYFLQVSPEIRVFIRLTEEGSIELFDIVSEATLQKFLEHTRLRSAAT